jgi:hypothetical protein
MAEPEPAPQRAETRTDPLPIDLARRLNRGVRPMVSAPNPRLCLRRQSGGPPMTTCVAAERKFLNRDELGFVEPSHYPQLAELEAAQLQDMRGRLRDLREKAKTVAHHKRREARGKGPAGAAGASGSHEHAARRKQIFSQALRRTNRQLQRLEHAEARARTAEGAQRALALSRRAQAPERPASGRHPRTGMRANPSLRRAMGVDPAMVGRASKAGKVAQAKRDAAS